MKLITRLIYVTICGIPDIRKQQEVLQESYMMVPDSKGRLRDAIEELTNLVVSDSYF